ncbi:tRNA (guanosine(18)-2'-O)-methyltransferase TrmH [soil metagenome]
MENLPNARQQKMRQVLARRQPNLAVVLEDVHDPHNLSAVMRSCDAVGIMEIYVVNTLTPPITKLGKRSSAGAKKWVTLHFFQDIDTCMQAVKAKYEQVYATHLSQDAVSLYDLKLTGSVALMFGNERIGLSPHILQYADGNFIIPMQGMVQSLNISVACAVSLFEVMRQRISIGAYSNALLPETTQQHMFDGWVKRDL